MKKTLVAMLLLVGLASPSAFAGSAPYAEKTQNGETVYTNAGSVRAQRVVHRTGATYTNRVAPPKVKVRKITPPKPKVQATSRQVAVSPKGSDRFSYVRRDANGFPQYVSYMTIQDGQWKPETLDLHAEVDRLARVHNVDPLLIKSLIRQESNFNPSAQSWVGAMGLMQLMPETAADLGVDPSDPRQNLAGGVAYLADQLNRFGDVRLALAAYNAGPGAVMDYGGVPPYEETQNYVANIYSDWRWAVESRR